MKKDVMVNFIMTVGISITLFFVNRYFAIYLGAQSLGLMKLFTQLMAYLNLAEIGLAAASSYAFYKPLVEKDYKQVSIVFNTITSLYNKIFLFILVVGLALSPTIPFFIKDSVVDMTIYLYWGLYVFATATNYLFVKYAILFTADQKYYYVRVVEGGARILCQLLQIYVIIKYQSFLGFILLLSFSNLVQFVLYVYYYKKEYHKIIKTSIKDNIITNNLKNLFWHKLAGLVVFNTDLILISKFISLKIVGVYASYLMVVQMLITVINIVLNVLKPRIGKFIAEHDKDVVYQRFKILNVMFLAVATVFVLGTYFLINEFVILWMGKEYVLPLLTVGLLLVNLFIQSFRGIVDIFKDGAGFFDDIHLPIAEAIINFFISLTLVQCIGLNGVIIGTICSNIIIICIAKPILVFKRCFNKTLLDYTKLYVQYITLAAVTVGFGYFIINQIPLSNALSWSAWIEKMLVVGIVSTLLTVGTFMTNYDFRQSLNFIKDNIK